MFLNKKKMGILPTLGTILAWIIAIIGNFIVFINAIEKWDKKYEDSTYGRIKTHRRSKILFESLITSVIIIGISLFILYMTNPKAINFDIKMDSLGLFIDSVVLYIINLSVIFYEYIINLINSYWVKVIAIIILWLFSISIINDNHKRLEEQETVDNHGNVKQYSGFKANAIYFILLALSSAVSIFIIYIIS